MQRANRVLIIGLDGATWDVLDSWMNDGSLPHLVRLRQGGRWGDLLSTIPPISAPAWSTFMTGKRPGKHGVFHFTHLFDKDKTLARDGKPILVDARNIKSSTLWDIAGHHNRKVAVINMPMTYPPRPVNGFMITGLLTPPNASVFTYPPELSRELSEYIIDLDRFIDHKPSQGNYEPGTTTPTLALVQEFQDMLEKRARTSLSLMNSNHWDVFMIVFTGTDRMGHYLWHYHRDADTSESPETQELCRAVRQYYVRLDEVVGELVEKAGEGVTCILISDHGMGPVPAKQVHLNNWLHQQGWLSIKSHGAHTFSPDSWLKRLSLPRDKVGRIIRRIPGLEGSQLVSKTASIRSATIDRDQSEAYGVPIFYNFMGIRVNLEGEKKQALCQEIMQRLEEIVDLETEQRVVQHVYYGKDYYHGPWADNTPDIIVRMSPGYGCGYHLGYYSSIITKCQTGSEPAKHRPEGIFIANGPRIMPNPEPLVNLNIEDVAPTVLYLMDLPIPSDMDGRVLTEILLPTILDSQPITRGEPMGFWPDKNKAVFNDETISAEDEEQIRERLQALGYFE